MDIVVNAVRRAMIGNLQIEGWGGIPALMVHRRSHYIRLKSLHPPRPKLPKLGYEHVLHHFTKGGRSMIAPRFND